MKHDTEFFAFVETGAAMTEKIRNTQYELASIPSGQTERINGFVEGANKLLNRLWNTGMEEMTIELEFRPSGNTHIYLETHPLTYGNDTV